MTRPSRPAQVLRLLLEAQAPRSGQEMGRLLGCSRAAVGKTVNLLREQGFVIAARPRLGYQLISEPDQVLPARVEARLQDHELGRPLLHFPEIDSTNLEARRRAEAGAPHGTCLVAEHQSAGRGRLDRRWLAPSGTCLLFSLILRPYRLGLNQVFGLTGLAALALCRALEAGGGPAPLIKWPNDLYLEGGKLAGILTEFTCRAERLEFVVVGVGLNVNLTPAQLKRLPAPAASLRQATGKKWDRAAILARFLDQAGELYRQALAGGWEELRRMYQRRFLLRDKLVTVRDGDQVLKGRARGVDQVGALILETDPGRVVKVSHGDVSILAMEEP